MNWPHYANGYDAQRFAPVDQITPANIASLTKVCSIRLGDDGPFQSSPLVISGIMYVTTAHTTVALDASDCALKWRSVYSPGRREVYGANRGVAYLNGRLFRGTPDGSLIALDSSTGRMIWKVDPADPQRGEFLSSAPLAWQGLVFIGTAGSDWGVKGRMMAFRASDGKEAWHFDTIPTGRETGANTWAWAPSTLTGGGGMWTSYSLDEGTGELFVPVGNPAPDFSPARRPGANLFTDSLVVLDARSGRLHWWYQLVPHDSHDYDLGAPAMLYRSSRGANIAAAGGKDGYVHAIDRATHNALFKTAVTTISNSAAVPTTRGVLVCPGSLGGVEWNGPAYDAKNAAIDVGSVDWCGVYTLGEKHDVAGQSYYGTAWAPKGPDARGWITSLDANTGAVRWRYHAAAPVVAGVTPTAGGLVFTGDLAGNFLALDSATGKALRVENVGGPLAGGVLTYALDGTQYVAMTVGNVSRLTFKTSGTPTVIIMALNASAPPIARSVPAATAGASTAATASGEALFAQNCAGCHGSGGAGGIGPSLKGESKRKDLANLIQWIENPKPPMPKLYPKPLNESEVRSVAAYVETLP